MARRREAARWIVVDQLVRLAGRQTRPRSCRARPGQGQAEGYRAGAWVIREAAARSELRPGSVFPAASLRRLVLMPVPYCFGRMDCRYASISAAVVRCAPGPTAF